MLCGGAINSPQLLLLSGIGPAAELAKAGVAARLDLPGVGKNLQDHLQIISRWEVAEAAMRLAAHKLPIKTKFVSREEGD